MTDTGQLLRIWFDALRNAPASAGAPALRVLIRNRMPFAGWEDCDPVCVECHGTTRCPDCFALPAWQVAARATAYAEAGRHPLGGICAYCEDCPGRCPACLTDPGRCTACHGAGWRPAGSVTPQQMALPC